MSEELFLHLVVGCGIIGIIGLVWFIREIWSSIRLKELFKKSEPEDIYLSCKYIPNIKLENSHMCQYPKKPQAKIISTALKIIGRIGLENIYNDVDYEINSLAKTSDIVQLYSDRTTILLDCKRETGFFFTLIDRQLVISYVEKKKYVFAKIPKKKHFRILWEQKAGIGKFSMSEQGIEFEMFGVPSAV